MPTKNERLILQHKIALALLQAAIEEALNRTIVEIKNEIRRCIEELENEIQRRIEDVEDDGSSQVYDLIQS